MVDELQNTGSANNGEPLIAPKSLSAEWSSPVSFLANPLCREMSIPVLAARCLGELDHDRRGERYTDRYGVELFRRFRHISRTKVLDERFLHESWS